MDLSNILGELLAKRAKERNTKDRTKNVSHRFRKTYGYYEILND